MSVKEIKAQALKKLKNNYTPLICSVIIMLILNSICLLTAKLLTSKIVYIVLILIVNSLLIPGYIKQTLNITKNKLEIFSKTDLFFKMLKINIVIFVLYSLLISFQIIAYNSLLTFIEYHTHITLLASSFMIVLGIILNVLIISIIIYLIISLSQIYFVAYENDKNIIKTSLQIMENHKIEYIKLTLSFIPLIILSILTFGILFLWLIPYMSVSYANFYTYIKENKYS